MERGRPRGRPKAPLALTAEERRTLERLARRPSSTQALALRARIVLACAEGASNKAVAERLGVWPQTVTKWRGRFVAGRLAGLADEPRPGRPRIADAKVEAVIDKTLKQAPPRNDRHWSTRSMARATGMNQTAVSRIWRAAGLKPHQEETWKLSADPRFIDSVRDVVGLYLDPPGAAMALCADERSGTPAPRCAGPVPAGAAGTIGLLAALQVAGDRGGSSPNRREFLRFLAAIDKAVPDDLDLHLVYDNCALHRAPAARAWLLGHPRLQLHVAPTWTAWLHLVERWFVAVTAELAADITAWVVAWNTRPRPFVWARAAGEALDNLTRLSATKY